MPEETQTVQIEWRGIAIEIALTTNWLNGTAHHIELRARQPLPVTETGYRSHFVGAEKPMDVKRVQDFVIEWLDDASQCKAWRDAEKRRRQGESCSFFELRFAIGAGTSLFRGGFFGPKPPTIIVLDAEKQHSYCGHLQATIEGRRNMMKAKILGSLGGLLLGAFLGGGTGIVGGVFGAVAGASVFMLIGAAWGFSAGPDVAQTLQRWRRK